MTEKETIKILIVDDHQAMRDALKIILELEPDFQVLGDAQNGKEAMALACTLSPDVIIMDIDLGEMHGIEVTEQILALQPDICVIGFSMHADPDLVKDMHKAGAKAFLTKSDPPDLLVAAIRNCRDHCEE